VVLGAVFLRDLWAPSLDGSALGAWFTIFVAIVVQAMPFLVLGVVLSGLIAAFVPAGAIAQAPPATREPGRADRRRRGRGAAGM
jgi:uncharacterized membrane protein YraQ (UPF0718 family)